MIGSNFAGGNCKQVVCHTTRMEQVEDTDRVCFRYQYTIIWNTSMLPCFLASRLDTPTTKNSMTPGELSKTSRKIDIRLTILYIMHHVRTYLWRNLCDIKHVPGIMLGAFPPSSDKKVVTILVTSWKKWKGIHFTYGTPFHTGPFLSFSFKKPPIGLMNGQHLWVPVGILQKKNL